MGFSFILTKVLTQLVTMCTILFITNEHNELEMKATQEQREAVELVRKEPLVKIDAVAGSGKSTTLKMIAEDNPTSRCLYLAYNKAMQMEAREKIPSNVECRTTHSLAYQAIGVHYHHKLSRPVGEYRNVAGTSAEIAKYYRIPPLFKNDKCLISSVMFGQMVKDCVAKFEQSADKEVSKNHVDKNQVRIALKIPPNSFESNGKQVKSVVDTILRYAKMLWKERVNVESKVLITHDTYMKLYQLSKPVLEYDIILLDEAQDANPCFLSIIENNIGKTKIVFVGDEYQAIYGWRGAVNAMQKFSCPSARLSKSFRYGKDVAKIASLIVDNDVVGNDVDTIVGDVDTTKPYTILFRTNGCLVQTALDVVALGKRVNIQTHVADLCKLISSAIALQSGDKKSVKHEMLFAFETWREVKEEATYSNGDLARVVDYVENGIAHKVLKYLSEHKNVDNPDVVLTTAHKSKGLEYDQVILANDFPSYYKDGVYVGLEDGERNLLYVAATRAKKVLQLNNTLEELFETKRQTMTLNCRIYSSEEFLNNPHLQLPQGEMAQDELGRVIDFYMDENLEDEEPTDYDSVEEFGNFVESITGCNPNMMPVLEDLKRESIILRNII